MIFSYDERKAGSYFGNDLYEKCIAVDETATASSADVVINIADAQTIVDAVFFTESNADGEKYASNVVTSLKVVNNTIKGYNLTMYDYESEENPAAVKITGYESGYACKGILKVQYTK